MLDLASIDLDELAMALEDHSPEHEWYIHRETGEIALVSDAIDEVVVDDDDPAWVWIEPIDSSEAYQDMEAFIELVDDPRVADLLSRAIEGRGAFRRFKDTLFSFDELRSRWFAFHDARLRRHTLAWLAEHDLIDATAAEAAMAQSPDPEVGRGRVDIDALAQRAKAGLQSIYQARLRDVLIFGSRARGEASAESDLDLLVVLDVVDSPFDELRCMDELLWRLTDDSGITVSALPVAADAFEAPSSPTLIRARAEAIAVR